MSSALLIVDMQNDFMPGGPLGVAGANELVPVMNALIPKFKTVIATQDWHPKEHVSFAANHPGKKSGDIVEAQGVSQVIGKMAYIPIPKGPGGKGLGMMGNWLLGIPKGSKNGSAAADFIKWLIKTDNMKTYVQNGGIPTRTSLLNDPALGQNNPYFPALAQSLAAQPNWRPRTDQWNAVETVYGTAVNQAVAGLKTPKDALTAAATQIRAAMKQAGYPS